MFRSILVPLDGSPFAEGALPWALTIARRSGATLHLGQVIPPLSDEYFWVPLPSNPLNADLRETDQSAARTYLESVVGRLRGAVPVGSCEVLEDETGVATAIHAMAEKVNADLVVTCTHGRGGFSRFWLGSIADELVRSLIIPVLLVRPEENGVADFTRPRSVQHVLVPLNGSALAEQILDQAVALGKIMSADFKLLWVIHPSLFARFQTVELLRRDAAIYLETVAARMRADGLQVGTQVVASEQAAAAIVEEASHGIDLIALETHGRGGAVRLLLRSTADKVVRGCMLPVLLCRAE